MKKIITSLGMIVFVGAVVATGTGAFFSDTETSTANVFTAGALDLKVDSVAHINGLVCFDGSWTDESIIEWVPENGDVEGHLELIDGENIDASNASYNADFPSNVPQAGTTCGGTWALTDLGPDHTFFDYGDLKPGDNGENTISLHVDNNNAFMCAVIHDVESEDNTQTQPESLVDTDGLASGELDEELKFFIWADDGDNIFDDETVLAENVTAEGAAAVYPLYTPATTALAGGSTTYLGVYWCYGDFSRTGNNISCDGGPVTNLTQTDSLKANITFYIEQARNNDNFTCPDIDMFETGTSTQRETVGAALAGNSFAYVAPTSCNFNVPVDFATPALAEASGSVPDGSTICVDTGIYGEFVVDRPLTFVGLNDPSGVNAAIITPSAASNYGINIGANNVTIKGLKVDGDGTTFTGNHIAGIRVLTDILDTDISGTRITQNVVTGLHHTDKTSIGIQLFAEETGLEDISDVDIIGNHITNIKSDTKGAHGIQVVNDLSDIVVKENTVSDIDGGWETGVAVDGNNPANSSGVMIKNNQLASASFSVQIEANAKSDEVSVGTNNLGSLLYGGSSGTPSVAVLNAVGNWWGTATPLLGSEVIVNPVGNVVDFTSPESSAFPHN